MNEVNKQSLKEVLFTSFLLYICILFIESLRVNEITVFLPNKITIFEILKNYFLALTIVIIIEFILRYELAKNYLIIRLFGLLVMFTFTLVAFNLFSKTWIFQNKLAINIIYISSIIYGCSISYIFSKIKLKRSLAIGVINYLIIAAIFVIFSFVSPGGYIFS